jgi:glycosyltransferase involved in cell wall biosynthesis
MATLRLAVLQRVIPSYRTALFKGLCAAQQLETKIFIGDDIPNSKVKSTASLQGINAKKLRTKFIKLGRRIWPLHLGLISELRNYKPDVILCEGESHFLGYVTAFVYRFFFNKKVALIHWCFISLPGEPLDRGGLLGLFKAYLRRRFNAFLLYSSFSQSRLIKLGIEPEKTFVATNVGDVARFIALADATKETPSQARQKLLMPDRFTVLYTGTLDKNKKPDLVIQLARELSRQAFNFVILGSGEMLSELREEVDRQNLENVFIPGRVTDQLALYYRASDVLVIPGRGGIIMSEAMAFGIPVVVHQADGTEYDLIKDGQTGFILDDGDVSSFKEKIEWLRVNPNSTFEMGVLGRKLVQDKFTTKNMIDMIIEAVKFSRSSKKNDR